MSSGAAPVPWRQPPPQQPQPLSPHPAHTRRAAPRPAAPQEAVSEQLKQQQELQRKLGKLAKTMDHLERAKREEEAPLLAEAQAAALKVGLGAGALWVRRSWAQRELGAERAGRRAGCRAGSRESWAQSWVQREVRPAQELGG